MPFAEDENSVLSLVHYFSLVSDPRVQGRCEHLLIDILVISICAILCGARTCTDFEDFAHSKEDWLRRYLTLPGGIPSHDTFRRVLSIIDPVQMENCFFEWTNAMVEKKKNRTLSVDGKSVGGACVGVGGRSALHLVNIYDHGSSLAIGQIESDGSGGETTAALEILDKLDIKGTTILADAKYAVRKVVQKIREKDGHYLVALKENNKFYLSRVEEKFKAKGKLETVESIDEKHGRREHRKASVIAVEKKGWDEKFFEQWSDLKTVIKITRVRTIEDKRFVLKQTDEQTGRVTYRENTNRRGQKAYRTSQEVRYFLTSRKMKATIALREIRKHWGIENNLHWVLDVAFGEDDWLVRAKRLSRNLAAIRKIGLNLIRGNASLPKRSVARYIKMAGWSDDILEKLVFQTGF